MRAFVHQLKIPIAIVVGFVLFGLIVSAHFPRPPKSEEQQAAVSEAFGTTSHNQEKFVQKPVTESSAENEIQFATVTFVVDGDTVELDTGERVRLIGIDAPGQDAPFYAEARNKLSELVLKKQVRMEKDVSNRDRFKRLLRYLYIGDTFVNLEMVRQGYASALRYPPNVKYSRQFLDAEKEARRKQLGMWSPHAYEKKY